MLKLGPFMEHLKLEIILNYSRISHSFTFDV